MYTFAVTELKCYHFQIRWRWLNERYQYRKKVFIEKSIHFTVIIVKFSSYRPPAFMWIIITVIPHQTFITFHLCHFTSEAKQSAVKNENQISFTQTYLLSSRHYWSIFTQCYIFNAESLSINEWVIFGASLCWKDKTNTLNSISQPLENCGRASWHSQLCNPTYCSLNSLKEC